MELFASHESDVGGLPIHRALPTRQRRTVGPWCFLDHAGPADLHGRGMNVAPHPHTGLATFSWMIEGEILHRDSLGSEQVLRPGQVNLMTAGRGIAHSEESLSGRLHLAQLWLALPDAERFCAPRFEHFPELPQIANGGFTLTLLAGEALGQRSPVPWPEPLLGVDLACTGSADLAIPLNADFEHGLMVLEGEVRVDGEPVTPGSLAYLAPGPTQLRLTANAAARVLLLGGAPWAHPPLLWWNFVGRTREEIAQFTDEWNDLTGHFAGVEVRGYVGDRLRAPPVPAIR